MEPSPGLTSTVKRKIQAAEMLVLRLIRGVTRRDRLWNEDTKKELNVERILQHVEETQLKWSGHVKRIPNGSTAHHWLQWKPTTSRPRGRPRKRWLDNIREAVERRGTTGGGAFRTVHGHTKMALAYLDRGSGGVFTECLYIV